MCFALNDWSGPLVQASLALDFNSSSVIPVVFHAWLVVKYLEYSAYTGSSRCIGLWKHLLHTQQEGLLSVCIGIHCVMLQLSLLTCCTLKA